MQERHVEDIANHHDPESCGVCREVHVEALTGGNAGQPLSFEIYLWGADRVVLTGRRSLAVASSLSRKIYAKTDALDATVIARFGAAMKPRLMQAMT